MRALSAAVALVFAVGCSQDKSEAPPTKGLDEDPTPTRVDPSASASAEPRGAVSLPDARSCHRKCLDAGATPESCRGTCEEACKERCQGRGSAFAEQCAADCRSELEALMAEEAK